MAQIVFFVIFVFTKSTYKPLGISKPGYDLTNGGFTSKLR